MNNNSPPHHEWNVSPKKAVEIQRTLSKQLVLEDRLTVPHRVAGVDVGFEEGGEITRAAIAVLSYPELSLDSYVIARRATSFPYIPGLLSFREVPAILDAFAKLEHIPDVLLVDGQGFAHPRRFGIACHLGLITGLPSIGVGKTRLIGRHDEVPDKKGLWVPLMDKQECVGAVLRSRKGVKPIYVSIGHRVCLETAINIVMSCLGKYKLPETTRRAHRLASIEKNVV